MIYKKVKQEYTGRVNDDFSSYITYMFLHQSHTARNTVTTLCNC